MAYVIEVMGLGTDMYPSLEAAAAALNAVQKEFEFRTTEGSPRQSALSFQRAAYSTSEIWEFLRRNRKDFGGNRPYIIAFVNTPLASSQYGNIFGSHEATEGLAVVTLDGCTQYVRDARRYCAYYMVRYSLSFINPLIKAHESQDKRDCYFHKKVFKPDIRASMDSGRICDNCMKQIDNPADPKICKILSYDERRALEKMRAVVSGDHPYALVMKGGGVKGLAFAGALLELEKYFSFDLHVGTSAGAITAVLLAANYSPSELETILLSKNFRDFMDARLLRIPTNLLLKRGCFPGEHFRLWIDELLHQKIRQLGEIKMANLPNSAVIYACRSGSGTVVFDSRSERRDTVAAFATRCSMSIPIFFFPQEIEGRRVYDGGLRNNFPVSRFLQDNGTKPFVALYLGGRDKRPSKRWLGSELLDIWVDGDDFKIVDSHAESVVVIDTSPVGTVDFRLHQTEKDFLLTVGRAAALDFLHRRKLDDGPDETAVRTAQNQAEKLRRTVVHMRRLSTVRRIAVTVLVFIAVYFVLPRILPLVSKLWSLIRTI
jgi:predicted acylesterase/phospholipase RssA